MIQRTAVTQPRGDVLSPSHLSRARSLTRPERSEGAPSVSQRQKNILEHTPTSPYDPWLMFVHGVTILVPSILLDKIGGLSSKEKQLAWSEKVALCFICAVLCGALGFLTFGLQNSMCILIFMLNIDRYS